MQTQLNWATRPLTVAEQKALLGYSSVNTLKDHEQRGLLPEEFSIGPNRKARHGEDLKAIVDARAAGASESQIQDLVQRLKQKRQQWLYDLLGGAV